MNAVTARAPFAGGASPEIFRISDPARAIIEKLRSRKAACFRVVGHSMWPALRPADLVFVKALHMDHVLAGQIVAFEREGRIFVHRALSRANTARGENRTTWLRTKGDSLDGADPAVTQSEYLGCVIRVHRGRRHIDMQSLTRRAVGRMIAAISPASRIFFGPVRAVRAIFRRH